MVTGLGAPKRLPNTFPGPDLSAFSDTSSASKSILQRSPHKTVPMNDFLMNEGGFLYKLNDGYPLATE
jgi:hypothetical protein